MEMDEEAIRYMFPSIGAETLGQQVEGRLTMGQAKLNTESLAKNTRNG